MNWFSLSLDATSALVSIIPGGSAAIQGVKYSSDMAKTLKIINEVNIVYNLGNTPLLIINGDPNGAWLSLGSALTSFIPVVGAPISGGFSIGCVYHDVENAILITP